MKKAGWAVAGGLVLLYLTSVSPHWFITSDSALYLMLGQSLAGGNGYTLSGQPHVHVPPGYPLLLAAMIRLGLGAMLWLNLAMIGMALVTLWLAYHLVKEQAAAP